MSHKISEILIYIFLKHPDTFNFASIHILCNRRYEKQDNDESIENISYLMEIVEDPSEFFSGNGLKSIKK